MSKTFLIGLAVIIIIGLGFGLSFFRHPKLPTKPTSTLPSRDAEYITANPVDLKQIEKISKFRSCAGHDSSGHNFSGQVETDRSMKHYLKPIASLANTQDRVALYAPFDGTVYDIDGPRPDLGPGQARGGFIELQSPLEPRAVVGIGHLNSLKTFQKGEAVKAGQLLGYAAVDGNSDFDLVVRALDQPGAQSHYGDTFDSVFNHMTESVLSQYAAAGLTPESLITPKSTRDASPCLFATVAAEPSQRTGPLPAIQASEENWVVVKH